MNIKEILGSLFSYGEPALIDPERQPLVVLHEDVHIESLLKYRETPPRIAQAVVVNTPASFIGYAETYGDNESHVYISGVNPLGIMAVLNHHNANGAEFHPRWGDHTATLKTRVTPEYSAWSPWAAEPQKWLKQVDFADFLQAHLADIVEPAAGHLLDLVLNFQEKRNTTVSSAVNLHNGTVQFTMDEQAEGANSRSLLEVPREIIVRFAPYHFHDDVIEVKGLFGYRIGDGGKLLMGIRFPTFERTMIEFDRNIIDNQIIPALRTAGVTKFTHGNVATTPHSLFNN